MLRRLSCVILLSSFALLAKLSSCEKLSPTLSPKESSDGYDVVIGGLNSYVSGSLRSRRAVILASDVYGYTVTNLRDIADKVATVGFYVVVPDFLHGDPYDPQNSKKPLEIWRNLHLPVKEVDNAKRIIKALRSKGVGAVGFAGFCWGGKLAVELAKTHHIGAAVLLHPSNVTVDDIKEVKAPIAILGAELDVNLPPSLLKSFEDILLSKHEIDSNVKIYRGVRHGWTLRYDPQDDKAVKAADQAHQDMIHWFNKYLKINKKRVSEQLNP